MLLRAGESILVVVDVQEKLLPALAEPEAAVSRVVTLMKAAKELEVPILVTEQYPRGLGSTVEEVRQLAPEDSVVEKVHFSAMREPAFAARLYGLHHRQAVVCGAETHVCVLQTAAELAQAGYATHLVVDACASRRESDKQAAVRRLARRGVEIVTTEMVVFEWLERAATDAFREVSKLIK